MAAAVNATMGANTKMFKSTIDRVTIPVLIPKRNKGHVATACTFRIQTNVYIDQLLFIPFITSLNGLSLNREELENLSKTISDQLKVDTIEIDASFVYPLDRVSIGYVPTLYNFKCSYNCVYDVKKGSSFSLTLSQPVRIKDFYSSSGNLYFSIEDPDKKVYFEDLIDHIQKRGKFIFYPPVSVDESLKLNESLDGVVFHPYDILVNVQDACKLKEIGRGGKIGINFQDVYSIYDMNYELTW